MGFLLFILSIVLLSILGPLGLIVTFLYNFFRWSFRYAIKRINYDLKCIAVSVDVTGNVMCKDLFNLCLIKRNGYKFGNRRETVSSTLGKNKILNTLSQAGIALDKLLNLIDKDHSIKSIDNNV